jgi:guanosine-3',5'-bis(diphosphate) 3'-pyrophosphohydrolase
VLRINDILDKVQSYLPSSELGMIEKAYIFSASVHQGQVRLSGEPYLTHPMEVCGILADMKLDAATLATGILHDTVEDTLTTLEQIEAAFGKEVAFLVDGLTKISKITLGNQEERQAENFRKMILAMSSDIRILLVRLADRIHNMRTLEFQTQDRQVYIAKETLELYAPLANRLGINWMKTELEDLSFRYLDQEAYNDLARRVVKKKDKREEYAEEVRGVIHREMDLSGIKAEVEGRAKHFYSIYTKMKEQRINFDEVYDLTAFRVVLDSDKEKDCYEALSVVHALWKPVPGRFKDYIAMPKANHYQSLHTTVIGPYGERMEIQIRTRTMHEWAEEGIASHWRYKEGRSFSHTDEDQIKKLRDLLDVQQEIKNPREFMSNLKVALFPEEVYVFTPNGDVKSFPKGSTPIDFAYSIHTDVGHKCIGAKVNRSIVPLKYQMKNGDTVEIITQAGHHPSKDWLKIAVTQRAMAKIRNWVKTEEREKSITFGKDLLEKEFRKHHLKFGNFTKSGEMEELLAECHVDSIEDLMAVVGYGRVSPKHIIHRFLPEEAKKEESADKTKKRGDGNAPVGVSLSGIDDVMVRYARCCDPIPGDEIIGYISRGRGVVVHTSHCPHIREMDTERLVDVHWDVREKRDYLVQVRIICNDKKGILADISAAISLMDVNITHAQTDSGQDGKATCDFSINVSDLEQFNRLVAAVRKVRGVVSVQRISRS